MKRILFPAILALITVLSVKGQDPEFEYYRNKEIKTLLGRNKSGGAYLRCSSEAELRGLPAIQLA
jgi:hypothetical protein